MTGGPSQHPARGPLDADLLASGLAAHPALRLELLASAPSTNEVAGERARAGEPEGLLVVADHQSAGRGRLDRSWESPAGTAVTLSLLLRPQVAPASWPWIPLLVGTATAGALAALGHPVGLKWPNDVLADDGRKLGGILVERVDTPAGPAAIVGIGVNVAMDADELPVPTATSLALGPGPTTTREEVVVAVAGAVHAAHLAWQDGGPGAASSLAAAYRQRCVTLGRTVRVDLPGGGVLVGTAVDVDEHGRLVVEGPNGPERVGAGDVVHVRAQD